MLNDVATLRLLRRSGLAVAVLTGLVACGGGGGNVRSEAPVAPPPVAPPPVAPPPTSPPPEPPPPTPATPPPSLDAHLLITRAGEALASGLTGHGTTIGIIDSGINAGHPAFGGRVAANLVYLNPQRNDLTVGDKVGHGTIVAMIAAGQKVGDWPGGIAPGARLLSARIISDTPPVDDGSGNGNEVGGGQGLGLEPVHQDLIDRGMRIMNNSWGGLYWNSPDETAPIAEEYRSFIRDHDGLVVFATGNESKANPTDMAALPSQPGRNGALSAADLEKGWLAVAALDTANPGRLASYSNACGLAMRYCLVAPGTVAFPDFEMRPGDAPDFYYGSGTSFAAPQVSGAAALVWEAFPYFDNDLVRQTLLGTATDLGAPGVDDVFGYGLLNVSKAAQGPARFDWGDVTVSMNNGTSRWSNGISGDGGLIKRGGGTLELAGYNDYTGVTRVESGSLLVTGELRKSDVEVGSAGRLLIGGALWGDLRNDGVVSVSTLSSQRVFGDFLQTPAGRLDVVLGNGALEAHGAARLDGGLHVSGVRSGYTAQNSVSVFRALNGFEGEFATLTHDAGRLFFEGSIRYESKRTVYLDIARLDVLAVASGLGVIEPASLSSARRLETAFSGLDALPAENSDSTTAFRLRAGELQGIDDPASAKVAFASMSGAQHAVSLTATFDNVDTGRRAIASRVGALAARDAAAGVWKESLGQGGSGGFARDGFSVDGWSIGRDHLLGNGLVAGFAFGELRGDGIAAARGDRNRDRQTQAQAYLARSFGGSYVMAQLGSGRFDRDMQRQVFAGADWQGVSTRYAGSFTQAAVEAGHQWRVGTTAFGPYVGAEQVRLRSDGFDEAGGDGFGLRSSGWDVQRSQAIAGMRARWDARSFSLHGYGEWQQTLSSSGFDLQASFTGIEAWSPIAGLAPARSGGLVGVGFESWLTPRARMMLGVDRRFGPRGSDRMASMQFAYGF